MRRCHFVSDGRIMASQLCSHSNLDFDLNLIVRESAQEGKQECATIQFSPRSLHTRVQHPNHDAPVPLLAESMLRDLHNWLVSMRQSDVTRS